MPKPTIWVAHLKGTLPDHGEVIQRMTFEAQDKDAAKAFAEAEALRDGRGFKVEGVLKATVA